ncbi:hypothetical protein X768_14225 [Mesorhizobium sp. LSJC265A00]|nr:hypothetical protein X768_14225 [Mesorhizobium sp. LSJC265A00]
MASPSHPRFNWIAGALDDRFAARDRPFGLAEPPRRRRSAGLRIADDDLEHAQHEFELCLTLYFLLEMRRNRNGLSAIGGLGSFGDAGDMGFAGGLVVLLLTGPVIVLDSEPAGGLRRVGRIG